MNASGVKIGVVPGMVATVTVLFPIFKLTMSHCFDAGCGEYEDLKLLGVVLASCFVGLVVALIAARLYTMISSRGRRN
jgi:hypothetical protein